MDSSHEMMLTVPITPAQVFDCMGFQRVILVEDDMEFSPDFFSFFNATAPILDQVDLNTARTYADSWV